MAGRTDWLLFTSALMGQFLSGFGSRIFSVSLPTVANSLHADILGISWAIIAYQLAGISLSVVFGRLGDIHGRYAIYGTGFAVMSLSSILCGMAPNVFLLVLFRLIQGVGAAMIASAARVLAIDAMPGGSEGRANGFMTMAFHSGLLIGPPAGGLVIDLVGWRWVFFLLAPLGLIGTVLTLMRARGRPRVRGTPRAAIDYVGAALLVALTVLLTLLLDRRSGDIVGQGRQGPLALAFVGLLVGFLLHERRTSDPIVNLSLFRIRMFTCSVLSLLIVATTTSAATFLLPFYLQDVLHFSPSVMGLMFLAAPIFTITLATTSGRLTDRLGPRIPASIGVLATGGAMVTGVFLRAHSHWLLATVLIGLTGLGSGFFNTPNQTAIIGSVPREYRGFATGMVQTMFGTGSLLGISLAGAFLTMAFHHYSGLPDVSPTADHPVAFVSSMNAIYLVCVGLVCIALAASLMRGGSRVEAATPSRIL
jgi:EmrB/QacA subfamily drug resistance transporter